MQLLLTSEDDHATCVCCQGDVSQSDFPSQTQNPLEDLLGPACYQRVVILDMGSASFIDTSGIGWLLNCHKQFQSSRGKLIIHTVPPMIEHVLRLLHLEHVLDVRADRAAALAAASAKRSI